MRSKSRIPTLLCVVALLVVSAAVLFPVLVMLSNSFKYSDDLFVKGLNLIPRRATLDNFRVAWQDYEVPRWFLNSVGTTLGITILQMCIYVLGAYGLVFFDFKGKDFWFAFFVASMIVPFQATMIPNYIIISKAGLLNTWAAVILPSVASAFGIFLLRQSFMTFPHALYEAALLEGCNSWQILWKIVVPVTKASISALAIVSFIDAWNLYFWPLLVMNTPQSQTLSTGLQQFIDYEMGSRWGPFMATATLACLPTLVIYLVMQRQIISTYANSGLKG